MENKTFVITTAIIKNEDKFLIAKRTTTKKFSPDQWEFISGFTDIPETAEQVILRELKEELNVDGKIVNTIDSFNFSDDEGRWVVIPFLIKLDNADIQINPKDHSEFKWVTANELSEHVDIEPFLKNPGIQIILS